jgi:hypothetical protein
MSDVFSKSNKMAVSFACLNDAFAGRGMMLIVNTLVKREVGNHTNIGELRMEKEIGSVIVEHGGRHPVQDEGTIMTAKGPAFCWWSVGGIHDAMHHFLHFLPLTLSIVLVLVMRFTLPILNDQGTKNVLDTVADFNRRTVVTDEFVHVSPVTNFILESVDECVGRMHIVESREESTAVPNEELETGDAANSDNVTADGIGSNGFMTLVNVTGGKRPTIGIAKGMTGIGSTSCELSRVLVGGLDKRRRRPQEEWAQCLLVMLLGSNDGRSGIDVVRGCGRNEVVDVDITASGGTTYVGTSLG